jgi:hypothetical protein
MRPLPGLSVVTPQTPFPEAQEIIGRENLFLVPTVENGALQWIISPGKIIIYLFTGQDLSFYAKKDFENVTNGLVDLYFREDVL